MPQQMTQQKMTGEELLQDVEILTNNVVNDLLSQISGLALIEAYLKGKGAALSADGVGVMALIHNHSMKLLDVNAEAMEARGAARELSLRLMRASKKGRTIGGGSPVLKILRKGEGGNAKIIQFHSAT